MQIPKICAGICRLSSFASVILYFYLINILSSLQGGLKAVVWTDAFQMLIIFAGLVSLIIGGTLAVGDVTTVWDRVHEGQRVQLIE